MTARGTMTARITTSQEVLINARKLISNRRNWTTGALKRAAAYGDNAYCAVGAVVENNAHYWEATQDALRRLALHVKDDELGVDPHHGPFQNKRDPDQQNWAKVVNYNNRHSHECVLSLFDAAIGDAE